MIVFFHYFKVFIIDDWHDRRTIDKKKKTFTFQSMDLSINSRSIIVFTFGMDRVLHISLGHTRYILYVVDVLWQRHVIIGLL